MERKRVVVEEEEERRRKTRTVRSMILISFYFLIRFSLTDERII